MLRLGPPARHSFRWQLAAPTIYGQLAIGYADKNIRVYSRRAHGAPRVSVCAYTPLATDTYAPTSTGSRRPAPDTLDQFVML